jgi:hypothetical protein
MTRCALRLSIVLGLLSIVLSGCSPLSDLARNRVGPISQERAEPCTDTFVPHPLDFVTTVRSEPVRMFDSNGAGVAVVYENQLCAGQALEVDLRWPATGNTHALGAILTLTTDDATLTRMVRAGSGYASGNPGRIHFGFPVGAQLERLEVRWPDGAVSTVDAPEPGALLTVTRR